MSSGSFTSISSHKTAVAELETAGLKLGDLQPTKGVVELDDARVEVTGKTSIFQDAINEVTVQVGTAALKGLAGMSEAARVLVESYPNGTTLHVRHGIDGVGTRVTIGSEQSKDCPFVVGNDSSGGNKSEPVMVIEVAGQESFLTNQAIFKLANPELMADVASFAVNMAQRASEIQSLPPK